MSKRNTIAAIDVGTTKVCTIVAKIEEDSTIRALGVGTTRSNGLHKGIVVNIDDAKESIRQSVWKAEQASGYKIESAYVGVTGRPVSSLNNRGTVTITHNDRLVRSDDLKRVLHSARSINVPVDRKLLHVIPRTYTIDGQVAVKNPVGMHGVRLDVETHIITAAVASIQNLAKCIRGIGIDIEGLVLEPLASAEAVLTEDEKQTGIILADIGGGTTDVAVFKEGTIYHTAIVPVAGYQLTRDISIGLGQPFDVAEEIKKAHGSVIPVYESKAETNGSPGDNGGGISYQDLSDIIRARVEEIINLIVLELPGSDYRSLVPAGLVLTGGSSNLAGIDILGREMLHLPVRVGTPTGISGVSQTLKDPAYATSVGLLLWGAKSKASQDWKSRRLKGYLKRSVSRLRNLFR